MAGVVWTPRPRNYEKEAPTITVVPVSEHPLLPKKHQSQPSAPAAAPVIPKPAGPSSDPLSATSDPLGAIGDPLGVSPTQPEEPAASAVVGTAFSSVGSVLVGGTDSPDATGGGSRFLSWPQRRDTILQQYAVTGQIKVQSELLSTDGASAANLGSNIDDQGKAQDKKVALDSKTRSRLEQLEAAAVQTEDGRTVRLTQQELIARVERLKRELKSAWEAEERVRALKTAIQVSKMLGDASFPQFFPSIFVLVTDVLDSFGELVYARVLQKGSKGGKELGASFGPADVATDGQETTKNWFYKVASIRELVPRLYSEMSILQCYRLLMPEEDIKNIIVRMGRMTRGIGDPLVACYARSYLVHKALQVMPTISTAWLEEQLWDMFYVFKQRLSSDAYIKQVTARSCLPVGDYFAAYLPALDWPVQCVAEREPTQEMLMKIVRNYRSTCKSAIVLNAVIAAFDAKIISQNALSVCDLIREADETAYPRFNLYASLGTALCEVPPPKSEQLQILNEVWAEIAKIDSPRHYLAVASTYLRLLVKEFTANEVQKLLRDIVKRVTPNKAYLELQPQLGRVVSTLLESMSDFAALFSIESFLKLLHLFEGEAATSNNKMIMDAFAKKGGTYSDPVLINNMMHVARQLHDSIDSLSFEDERRQLAALINAFIRKIHFGRDFETQLNFFTDCRAAFANLDAVKDTVVLGVARLSMQTRSFMRGKHTKRTAAFVKACIAFCFITIPSIESLMLRLHLNLLTAQAALCNQLLPQMDASVKAAVTLVGEIQSDSPIESHQLVEILAREEALVATLSGAIALLIAAPGHPEHGPFYLVTGLLNVLQACKWQRVASLPTLHLRMLAAFNALSQRRLPYRVPGVDSNDVLYAAEPSYQEALRVLATQVLDSLLTALAELRKSSDGAAQRTQTSLALQLADLIASSTTIEPPLAALVVQLVGLAVKSATLDKPHARNVGRHLCALATAHGKAHAELWRCAEPHFAALR